MVYYNFTPKKKGFFERISLTTRLIILNVLLFIVFYSLISAGILSFEDVALTPLVVLSGSSLWTFISSMFMHSGITHLLFNMISLFFIGTLLERIIGRKRYFWFYMISGIFAGLIFVLLSGFFGGSSLGAKLFGDPGVLGVGASGAIFGLVGVLSVLIPNKKISLIAGPLIAIIFSSFLSNAFPGSAFVGFLEIIFTIYIFASIFAIFSFNPRMYKISLPLEMPFWLIPLIAIIPLVVIGLFVDLPIGNSAHFGGLLVGLIYGFYLKKKYPQKVRKISSWFS
ncbi:MAG: rhomboid family intramembrane serine protease [Nanoarchaeota archaeon]|nr:rhomboid family intramembrane serine protease [Nanoarchaeota archaeon]